MTKEPREMFSAVFEKYDNTFEPDKSKLTSLMLEAEREV